MCSSASTLNVPLADGGVTDDSRIRAPRSRRSVELRERGASLVLASHLGRPKGRSEDELRRGSTRTGRGTARRAPRRTGRHAGRAVTTLGASPTRRSSCWRTCGSIRARKPTIRAFAGRAGGAGRRVRGRRLRRRPPRPRERSRPPRADARERPSGGRRPPARARGRRPRPAPRGPERPYVAVLGGAKVSDKLGVIDALIDRVDALLVGGAMAFTLLAAEGARSADRRVEPDRLDEVRGIRSNGGGAGVQIELPDRRRGRRRRRCSTSDADDRPRDRYPGRPDGARRRARDGRRVRARSWPTRRPILWNGPMGVFELDAVRRRHARGRGRDRARAPAFSVVGGGDSIAAVRPGRAGGLVRPPVDRRRRVPRVPRGTRPPRHRDPGGRLQMADRTADHRGQLEDAQDAPGGDPGGAEAQLPARPAATPNGWRWSSARRSRRSDRSRP